MDVAGFDRNLGAHRLQTFDVLINRTRTDAATARQRYSRFAEAGQQRAQHQDRCAHGFHHFVRRFQIGDGVALQRHEMAVLGRLQSHLAQQLQYGRYIVQVRHVAQMQLI